ncbi:Tat binding protein 1-interacting protein-domain-containing protein [Polychytrium aggregatum]|uniref:Tat binding protein 1-interacting protein-domain-containing protein n=1 Tax=Polychytrium aggregatum TaxID=110093 RepID=UPI0022FE5781|nr:Tat binding protein 1-interacting protein-domain-containing protein [Polychytrium aggregatum]KAI9208790.1 Tat binding protein 1-interacting protein-domain-containing protein [Polychytrium aggregatum]
MGKPQKAKASSGSPSDHESQILGYLRKQNRPYSAVDVFNNLKGEIGKAVVTKILTQMQEEQTIHGKLYGKQWVYAAKQDEGEAPSTEILADMDMKIVQLRDQIVTLKTYNKQAQATLSGLTSSLTSAEMKTRLATLKSENEGYLKRLESLRGGSDRITDAERKKIVNNYEKMKGMWKKRKRKFKDIWSAMTENMPGKPSELMEELGIETDEMAGMDVNADPFSK